MPFSGPASHVKVVAFDRVVIHPCPSSALYDLEKKLIQQYQPKHNIQHNRSRRFIAEHNLEGMAIPSEVLTRRVPLEVIMHRLAIQPQPAPFVRRV